MNRRAMNVLMTAPPTRGVGHRRGEAWEKADKMTPDMSPPGIEPGSKV
jgi:hypothetical protein